MCSSITQRSSTSLLYFFILGDLIAFLIKVYKKQINNVFCRVKYAITVFHSLRKENIPCYLDEGGEGREHLVDGLRLRLHVPVV